MKHSIKRLPKRTQEELNVLLRLIKQYIPSRNMVMLYGSYARGGYVLWDEQIEFGYRTTYQSDLDIMIVCQHQSLKQIEWILRNDVADKYHRLFAHRRHASPQFIVEYLHTLNKELEKSQYFFTEIVREGIMLYDDKKYQLAKPRKLSYREIRDIAIEEFEAKMKWGNELLDNGYYNLSKKYYVVGSFILHQTCEKYYNAISLVFRNYSPKNHKLKELGAIVKDYSRDLAAVFPLNTDFEVHCYDLLCRAYIESRYNKDFEVTKDEYKYLIQRTEILKEITNRICAERIKSYDLLIGNEE